jgi:hypothetical protein
MLNNNLRIAEFRQYKSKMSANELKLLSELTSSGYVYLVSGDTLSDLARESELVNKCGYSIEGHKTLEVNGSVLYFVKKKGEPK